MRAGRKRKSGPRDSNGRLKAPAVNYRALAAEQPHRKWLPEAARLDQRADSVLGCLYLNKHISEELYLAGEIYARRMGAYRATIEGPRALAGNGRGYDCRPSGCQVEPDICECARRRRDFNELFQVLTRAGHKELMTVSKVVVYNQNCMAGEIKTLRTGLSALARYLSFLTRYLS